MAISMRGELSAISIFLIRLLILFWVRLKLYQTKSLLMRRQSVNPLWRLLCSMDDASSSQTWGNSPKQHAGKPMTTSGRVSVLDFSLAAFRSGKPEDHNTMVLTVLHGEL